MKRLKPEGKSFKKVVHKLDKVFDLNINKYYLVVIVFALILIAAPTIRSDNSEQTKPTTPTTAKTGKADTPSEYVPKSIEWVSCDDGLCGTLDVPKDYSDLSQGTLTLALYKNDALVDPANAKNILINPGGPGASGIEAAKSFSGSFEGDFIDKVNIIGWDPRGVGASTKTECSNDLDYLFFSTDPTPDTQLEKDNIIQKSLRFSQECWKNSADLIPYITSENSVKDMDSIRQAISS